MKRRNMRETRRCESGALKNALPAITAGRAFLGPSAIYRLAGLDAFGIPYTPRLVAIAITAGTSFHTGPYASR